MRRNATDAAGSIQRLTPAATRPEARNKDTSLLVALARTVAAVACTQEPQPLSAS